MIADKPINLQIRAQAAPWYKGIELAFLSGRPDSRPLAATLTFAPIDDGFNVPTLFIPYQEAQLLMDDLWASGIRPTEAAGSAGALSATRAHLDDMRKIAFDLLERIRNVNQSE